MEGNNNLAVNENQMNDEQFLAYQMELARVEEKEDMELDNLEDDGNFEAEAMDPNHLQNRPILNYVPNPVPIQVGNQPGIRGTDFPALPVTVQNNRAGNGDVAQDINQDFELGNNQSGNQAGNQRNNRPDNEVGNQGNGQVINQSVRRGNQACIQAGQRAHNNAAAGNGRRAYVQQNVGFGNFPQPQPLPQQGILQAYPQGHAVFGHQQGLNPNMRNSFGPRRQRLLTPLEAARANRLKGIIDNMEFELRRNREIYKRLYGPIPGGLSYDAG